MRGEVWRGRTDAGASLVDVVVGLLVLSVGVTVVAMTFTKGMRSLYDSRQRDAATAQASQALEQARSLPYAQLAMRAPAATASVDPATCASCSLAATGGSAPVALPDSRAAQYHARRPSSRPWYDLCSDGTVRAWSASGPCTGGPVTTPPGFTATYVPSSETWELKNGVLPAAVYYVHHDSALLDHLSGTATVLVSRADAVIDAMQGNARASTSSVVGLPEMQGLALLADRDIRLDNASTRGSATLPGLVIAGEQFRLHDDSRVFGAVLALDNVHRPAEPVDHSALVSPASRIDNTSRVQYDGGLFVGGSGNFRLRNWQEL
ncbi:MAG: hypothetical protein M3P96_07495 [Actinomycetota bacterium]|nr:hypothetical protein [Actinomycetota bacterium]